MATEIEELKEEIKTISIFMSRLDKRLNALETADPKPTSPPAKKKAAAKKTK